VTPIEIAAIATAPFVYLFCSGAVYAALDAAGHNKADDPTALFGGLLWPVAAPIWLGSLAFARLSAKRGIPAAKVVQR
jgi:hypothetical protein